MTWSSPWRTKLALIAGITWAAAPSALAQTVPPLAALFRELGTPRASQAKIELAKIGAPALPGLRKLALTGDTAASIDAIRLIGTIGTHEDEDFLIDLITDPVEVIRVPADDALEHIVKREVDKYLADPFRAKAPDPKQWDRTKDLMFGSEGSEFHRVMYLGERRVEVLNLEKNPTSKLAESLLSHIAGTEPDGPLETDLVFVGGLCTVGPDLEAFSSLWKSDPSLVRAWLNDPTRPRAQLLTLIAYVTPAELRSTIVGLADSPVDSIRAAACMALKAFKDEEVQQILLAKLTDPIPQVRYEALSSLNEIDPLTAIGESAKLADDKVLHERALNLIADTKDDRCLSPLALLIRSENVAVATAACLAVSNYDAGLPVLVKAIASGSVRGVAASLLSNFQPEKVLPTLTKCLEDRDASVVVAACGVAAKLKVTSCLRKLISLRIDKRVEVRNAAVAAVVALTTSGGPQP